MILKLTPQQRAAVAQRHNWTKHDQRYWILGGDVAKLERIINAVLASDPIGTVRRDPQTGVIAIRAVYPCQPADCEDIVWHYVDKTGQYHHTRTDDCDAARRIAHWDVIYPSEVSS